MLTPFERFLGMSFPFGELVSVDAFEEVSGVHRLRFQAAETLSQVFTNRTSGVLDVGGARALWPIHQEVARRFATRYGITELEVCYAELVRLSWAMQMRTRAWLVRKLQSAWG